MIRAENASPWRMSWGFSSELSRKSGSTMLTAGRLPAAASAHEPVDRAHMVDVAEQAERDRRQR